MRCRWFFRVSLTLLILCLAAWGWSYLYAETVFLQTDKTDTAVSVNRGAITYQHASAIAGSRARPGWHLSHQHVQSEPVIEPFSESIWGFRWADYVDVLAGVAIPVRVVAIPHWFPTLLLATLTWWSWRKRRKEGDRGFPVEGATEKKAENKTAG